MTDTFAQLGAILRVIHPDMYAAGRDAIVRLSENPDFVTRTEDLMNILRIWATPFSALSVISNRATPIHIDTGARPAWPDILLTVGSYRYAEMDLPTLGYRLEYRPNTIVAILSKAIPHGVQACQVDRVCIAMYMKDNVHSRLGVRPAQWVRISDLMSSS